MAERTIGQGVGLSMQHGEVWKDIPGYEDLYQVSNMGRIRAFPKMTRIGNKKRFCEMRFLSPIVQHSGYAHIGLWRNGDCKQARLHRLVAEAFCVNDNPQCKTQVNHLNEDKLDNRAENLEWVTAKENTNYGTCIERRIYGRERAVECVDMEGNVHCKFRSQAEANSWCGVARNDGHIAACCNGNQKTAYGYRWRYATEGVMPRVA